MEKALNGLCDFSIASKTTSNLQNSLEVPENCKEHFTCRGSPFEFISDRWWRMFPLQRCGLRSTLFTYADFFLEGFLKLMKRYEKYLNLLGTYVEK